MEKFKNVTLRVIQLKRFYADILLQVAWNDLCDLLTSFLNQIEGLCSEKGFCVSLDGLDHITAWLENLLNIPLVPDTMNQLLRLVHEWCTSHKISLQWIFPLDREALRLNPFDYALGQSLFKSQSSSPLWSIDSETLQRKLSCPQEGVGLAFDSEVCREMLRVLGLSQPQNQCSIHQFLFMARYWGRLSTLPQQPLLLITNRYPILGCGITRTEVEFLLKALPEGTFVLRLRRCFELAVSVHLKFSGHSTCRHAPLRHDPVQGRWTLTWGPLVYSSTSSLAHLLSQVEDLKRCHPLKIDLNCWAGQMTADQAMTALITSSPLTGSYLMRFSDSCSRAITITLLMGDQNQGQPLWVQHQRIIWNEDGGDWICRIKNDSKDPKDAEKNLNLSHPLLMFQHPIMRPLHLHPLRHKSRVSPVTDKKELGLSYSNLASTLSDVPQGEPLEIRWIQSIKFPQMTHPELSQWRRNEDSHPLVVCLRDGQLHFAPTQGMTPWVVDTCHLITAISPPSLTGWPLAACTLRLEWLVSPPDNKLTRQDFLLCSEEALNQWLVQLGLVMWQIFRPQVGVVPSVIDYVKRHLLCPHGTHDLSDLRLALLNNRYPLPGHLPVEFLHAFSRGGMVETPCEPLLAFQILLAFAREELTLQHPECRTQLINVLGQNSEVIGQNLVIKLQSLSPGLYVLLFNLFSLLSRMLRQLGDLDPLNNNVFSDRVCDHLTFTGISSRLRMILLLNPSTYFVKSHLDQMAPGVQNPSHPQPSKNEPTSSPVPSYTVLSCRDVQVALQHPSRRLVGQGNFGQVYCTSLWGNTVAIKVLLSSSKFGSGDNGEARKQFLQEMEICGRLRHPHIVSLLGACDSPDLKAMICEFVPGKLTQLLSISSNQQISLVRRLHIIRQIARAGHWWSQHVVHCDLKPDNILLDAELEPRVCDFGLSQLLFDEKGEPVSLSGQMGSALWMAPELLRKETFDAKADVYALSLLLWQLIHGVTTPYPEISSLPTLRHLVGNLDHRPSLTSHPDLVACPALRTLLSEMWHRQPTQRPSFLTVAETLDRLILTLACGEDQLAAQHIWSRASAQSGASFSAWSVPLSSLVSVWHLDVSLSTEEIQTLLMIALDCKVFRSNLMVTLDQWKLLIQRFGPLGEREPNDTALSRMRHLFTFQKGAFHGTLSPTDITRVLQSHSAHSFLLRWSNSQPATLVASANLSSVLIQQHVLISISNAGYGLISTADQTPLTTFDSLDALFREEPLHSMARHAIPSTLCSVLFGSAPSSSPPTGTKYLPL